jgi:hypothetical protein
LGCGSDAQPTFRDPALSEVPERLAQAATSRIYVDLPYSEAEASSLGEVEVSSAEPAIAVVEWLDTHSLELRGVGVGKTTIAVQHGERITEYPIEVATPTRFEAVLVAGNPFIAEGLLQGKAIRALEPQDIVILYYDPVGFLAGRGLADIVMPPGIAECKTRFDSRFDAQCWRPAPGAHSIRVMSTRAEQLFEVVAVDDDDIVDLVLVRAEEVNAAPADLIRVDALGVTEVGTMVYGMHAIGTVEWLEVPFPIRYETDADADRWSLEVSAAGFTKELRGRGGLVFEPPFWERY